MFIRKMLRLVVLAACTDTRTKKESIRRSLGNTSLWIVSSILINYRSFMLFRNSITKVLLWRVKLNTWLPNIHIIWCAWLDMASNGYCVLHSEGYNHVFNNYNEKHKKDDKRASYWPKKKKGAKNKVSLVLALPLSFRLQLFVSERRERKKTRHETVRRSAKYGADVRRTFVPGPVVTKAISPFWAAFFCPPNLNACPTRRRMTTATTTTQKYYASHSNSNENDGSNGSRRISSPVDCCPPSVRQRLPSYLPKPKSPSYLATCTLRWNCCGCRQRIDILFAIAKLLCMYIYMVQRTLPHLRVAFVDSAA